MGLGDFFRNIFGKKTCAFCGGECGMMSRTKIKGDVYICSKCDDMCSAFIRKSRYTKEELAGHMEYIKRSDRIFKEVIVPELANKKRERYPSATSRQGIEFYDDYGMFRIMDGDRDNKDRYPVELIRYDQVASYEIYYEEADATEPGKPKVFKEAGIIINMVGGMDDLTKMRKGLSAHPYIIDPIKVCFAKNEREKEDYFKYADNAIHHFDYIFGVNDDTKGLFDFGMTKKEKRDLLGAVGFAKAAMGAVKAAKSGDVDMSEDEKAEMMKNLNAMNDADTGGLAEYTRRADAAEAKIN